MWSSHQCPGLSGPALPRSPGPRGGLVLRPPQPIFVVPSWDLRHNPHFKWALKMLPWATILGARCLCSFAHHLKQADRSKLWVKMWESRCFVNRHPFNPEHLGIRQQQEKERRRQSGKLWKCACSLPPYRALLLKLLWNCESSDHAVWVQLESSQSMHPCDARPPTRGGTWVRFYLSQGLLSQHRQLAAWVKGDVYI